ncbi:Ig-like domain-containing protein [Paractinoplanes toevensis]|uniref:Bacterial Ig domain-containing protein n=1 Tax=Paractinoplanes toevensis TaxID=571911 RepID=A0A919TBA8_9ACTN|nr:Ig-like domain-containing protein [Actinoplanes toevensis]GIM91285.1 hypothetical protein Ato02nite_030780 [Actinoplanes toevensis]
MIQRRKVIIGTLGVAAAAATVGGSAPGPANAETTTAAGPEEKGGGPVTPVRLSVTPGTGSKTVSPSTPIVVTVRDGDLQSVAVTAGPAKIAGSVQADGTWRSTGKLAYGKTYRVVVTATDRSGAAKQETSSFTTVKPQHLIETTFRANAMSSLKKGQAYGAGQPVIIAFSRAVNKKAAEKAIEITTSPAVEGKFYWADGRTVHWRPARYWAGGTSVTVNVNLFGVRLGNGVYGEKNASTRFTIGRQLIAITDNKAHLTKVYINGKLVRTMKCSLGKGGSTTGANGQAWATGPSPTASTVTDRRLRSGRPSSASIPVHPLGGNSRRNTSTQTARLPAAAPHVQARARGGVPIVSRRGP